MKEKDYQSTIFTTLSSKEVVAKISQVSLWWAKDFEGKSEKVNDVFTVRFQNGDMYKAQVSEILPNKKIVWQIIDSYQGWHDNHTEWVGTQIVWDILSRNDKTEVKMTHVGLVPAFECFDKCSQGWNYLMQKSLQKFFTDTEGMPA